MQAVQAISWFDIYRVCRVDVVVIILPCVRYVTKQVAPKLQILGLILRFSTFNSSDLGFALALVDSIPM